MRISKVTIMGFHNTPHREVIFDEKLTYLHGTNGAGKSTILNAIQLGLLGYLPGTVKQKSAIFRHSSSSLMSVQVDLVDGDQTISVCRRWMGKASDIKTDVEVTPATYNVESLVSQLELPIFNFNDFCALSSNQLKDWFIQFLPKAEFSVDWKKEMIKASMEAGVFLDPSSSVLTAALQKVEALNASGMDQVRLAYDQIFSPGVSFKKDEMNRLSSTLKTLIFYDDVPSGQSEEFISEQIREYKSKLDALKVYQRDRSQYEEQLKKLSEFEDLADSVEDDPQIREWSMELDEANDLFVNLDSQIKQLIDQKADKTAERRALNQVVSGGGVCSYTHSTCDQILKMVEENRKKVEQLGDEIQDLSDKIMRLSMEQDEAASAGKELRRKIDASRNRYELRDRLNESIKKPDDIAINKSVEDDAQFYLTEISSLEDSLVKIRANEQYERTFSNVNKQLAEVTQEYTCYNAWKKLTSVSGLQTSDEANKPFLDLVESMNKFISPVFGEKVSAHFNLENKANSFSFGLIRNGQYIMYDLLSSGEKCMFALAMMLALTAMSSSPLKLVLADDILDHLDDKNIEALFDSLLSVDGIQMIFAGVKVPANINKYFNIEVK